MVETDFAMTATLNKGRRPVAFSSRVLLKNEVNHPPVEKEAYIIVESVRDWKYYLTGRHFTLITDEEAVIFIQIKLRMIKSWGRQLRWQAIALIWYPVSDWTGECARWFIPWIILLGNHCSAVSSDRLMDLRNLLCHPAITWTTHYYIWRILPLLWRK